MTTGGGFFGRPFTYPKKQKEVSILWFTFLIQT